LKTETRIFVNDGSIDNSHRVLPNSDATVFFLEVLPKLSKE